MKYLLFFAALIATAQIATAELICQCSTPTSGPTCTKDTNTCTIQGGQCYSVEREISIEKEKIVNATSQGCQDDKGDVCNEGVVFISSEDAFYLLSNVKCCNQSKCNQNDAPKLPSFSEVNKTLSSKKLVCPSCFAYKNKTCEGEQMYCKENQDKCFTVSGTVVTKGSTAVEEFAAKGCATTKTILKINTTLTFGENSYKLENVQVVEAKSGASWISNCLSFAILLPSVLWFLLDSSLY